MGTNNTEDSRAQGGNPTIPESDSLDHEVNSDEGNDSESIRRLREVSLENKQFRKSNAALKRELADLKAQVDSINESTAEKNQEYKKLYETSKAKLAEAEKTLNQTRNGFAFKLLKSDITSRATAMGCKNPDALVKLMGEDLSAIELELKGSDLSYDSDSVKSVVEKAFKEHSYLFEKKAPRIADNDPSINHKFNLEGSSDFQSSDELIAALRAKGL
jgi:hypothetical protein